MIDPHQRRQSNMRFVQDTLLRGIVPWWRPPTKDFPTMRDLLYLYWIGWSISVTAISIIMLLIVAVTLLVERLSGASGPHRPHDPGAYLPLAAVLTVALPVALVILIWYAIRQRARRKRGLVVDHPDHRPLV